MFNILEKESMGVGSLLCIDRYAELKYHNRYQDIKC